MQLRFDYSDIHLVVITVLHVEAVTIILTFGQNIIWIKVEIIELIL
jgi:hypothetical protein